MKILSLLLSNASPQLRLWFLAETTDARITYAGGGSGRRVNDGAVTSLRRVTVGAADSGAAGYRLLRVAN